MHFETPPKLICAICLQNPQPEKTRLGRWDQRNLLAAEVRKKALADLEFLVQQVRSGGGDGGVQHRELKRLEVPTTKLEKRKQLKELELGFRFLLLSF